MSTTMSMPLTYAIGDVHGRSDLLIAIVDFVERDAARRRRPPRIIFLGDIVDRGRDSRGCLNVLGRVLADHPGSTFIRGNHDDWFLRFLENDRSELYSWFHDGGRQTLDSYCDLDVDPGREFILEHHPAHLSLLRNSSFIVDEGPMLFAHAGIRPSAPIAEQSPKDLLWIKDPFLDHRGTLKRVVVHGHTVMKEGLPVVTENRISMDTGACFSGRLSVLVIDQAERELCFWQTAGDRRSVVEVEADRCDRGHGTLIDDLSWLGG
ncbi:metallophosphoesterase [Bosea sp. NBC_00550]|uniref:metallophosphoesterase n=1 Tax=Bosea sp. NBC_00550 TaxID=2969621 RepID=UPI002230F134|nr:metallophosphoesterase [Bosea sp. NBC_00550]UZF95603.1 metallophosphoesterase [Bosea sp. NBC_00550]